MCVVRQGLLTFSFSVRCGRPLFILYTSGTSYIQFLSQMWEASIHIVYVRDFLHSVSQSDVGGLYSYCIHQGLLTFSFSVRCGRPLFILYTSGTSYIQFLSQMWEASIHIVYVRDFLHSVSQSDVGGLYSYCICPGLLTFSFSVRCGRPLFILYTSGTSYIQFLSQMWEASIHIVYVRDFLHSVSQSDVGGLYSYCIRQGLLTFSFSVRCGRPLFILYTSGTSYIQFLSQMWEASIHIVYVRDFLHSVSQSDVGGLYSYCIRQGLLTFSFSVRCGRPLFILYTSGTSYIQFLSQMWEASIHIVYVRTS